MLKKLSLKGVGPAPEMEVEFAERLTVITGDNGLGKSFILDAVWFALTEEAFGEALLVENIRKNDKLENLASLAIFYEDDQEKRLFYYRQGMHWGDPDKVSKYDFPNLGGPLLYFGAEGKVGFYDPARPQNRTSVSSTYNQDEIKNGSSGRSFNINNINTNINGIFLKEDHIKINGYLIDLTYWLHDGGEPYANFQKALKILSENPESPISFNSAKRIADLTQPRIIPHINTENGETPITLASAGILRILCIAYMIVNCWHEHKLISETQGKEPGKSFLLLIDEIEIHLHPRWQRKILAAVLEVAKAITEDEGFQVQVICTTHSPIVLTGIEPHFDPEKDKLLDLQLTPGAPGERGTVELREVEFEKLGSVGEWLMSDMFNVDDIPEPNAEALKKRAALFKQEKPTQAEIDEVDNLMREHFAPDHQERTHWVWLAKKKGLTLRGQQ